MADFKCTVETVSIHEHENADALEIAKIDGKEYQCIVGKHNHKNGDKVVYIPEQAIVPEWLINELGLEGKLSGKKHNRVKTVKLRGVVSQGLVLPVKNNGSDYIHNKETGEILHVNIGDNVTEFLGVEKWEPPIPVHMSGQVFNAHGKTLKYDIENFKNYPDVLEDGEEVVFTEKLHGTWCCIGCYEDEYIVTSKGLSAKGLAFKNNGANADNLYLSMMHSTIDENYNNIIDRFPQGYGDNFYILGEIFGQGVQDLKYGLNRPQFRVFDIYIGKPNQGEYVSYSILKQFCEYLNVEMVPELYIGPFSKEVMKQYTNGKETVSGKGVNVREGIVIKPIHERRQEDLGRVILKNVSEDYLLRKGKVTEYE